MGYNAVSDIRLVAVAFQICEIPRNSPTVQGHPRSSILVSIDSVLRNFLLVISSNFGRSLSPTLFRDIDAFCSKIAFFPIPPHPCLTPLADERPATST